MHDETPDLALPRGSKSSVSGKAGGKPAIAGHQQDRRTVGKNNNDPGFHRGGVLRPEPEVFWLPMHGMVSW